MNFDYDSIKNLVFNTVNELWGIDPDLMRVLNQALAIPTADFISYVRKFPYHTKPVKDLSIEKIVTWALLGPNLVLASTLNQLLWRKDRYATKALPVLAGEFVRSLKENNTTAPSLALQIILRRYVKPPRRAGRQPLLAIHLSKLLDYYPRRCRVDPAENLKENIENTFSELGASLIPIWFIGIVASKDPWDPPECNYSAWGIVKMAREGLYTRFLDLMDEEWRSRWERPLQEFLSEYRNRRRRYG